MKCVRRSIAALLVVLAVQGTTARAQWGWGGWGAAGAYGGASTVAGDAARGMGAFAVGVGQANLDNAAAAQINAQTAAQWNNYMYQSQMEANRRYHQKLASDKRNNAKSRDEIYNRLRNDPTTTDIVRGDALNVAFDEVTNPKVYLKGVKAANAKIKGTAVREVPFQYASAAITTSMDQLTQGGPPPALKAPQFDADRAELRQIAAAVRKQNEEEGKPRPESLEQARTVLRRIREKVEATIPKNTPARTAAEKYVKALFGLTQLLQSPAIDVLLSGVDKRPEVSIAELLEFMKVFNFRFGAATTPQQKAVYNDLYPLLAQLRTEVEQVTANPNQTAAANPDHPGDLFSKLDYDQLNTKGDKAPPPAPAPAPK